MFPTVVVAHDVGVVVAVIRAAAVRSGQLRGSEHVADLVPGAGRHAGMAAVERGMLTNSTTTRGHRMASKFVVKKGSTGQYRFNLVAGNGEIIATSESYTTKAAALKGVESVKKNAPGAVIDDQTD
jgi:uncharacterized protein YegP (UPF0339 family)